MGLLLFSHQYWFMNAVSLSVDQWFNAGTIVRGGNFRVWVIIWPKPELSLYSHAVLNNRNVF